MKGISDASGLRAQEILPVKPGSEKKATYTYMGTSCWMFEQVSTTEVPCIYRLF
jgi:hypothetical protein